MDYKFVSFAPSPKRAHSDDKKYVVTLGLLCVLHRSISHGCVQDGGEVGGTVKLDVVKSVLVGIQNTLGGGGGGGIMGGKGDIYDKLESGDA